MTAFGRGALEWLAGLWVLFGGLGLVMTATSLADPLTASPGWQWTVCVSVALVLSGIAIPRRYRGARWIAAAAVAGGLAEAVAWLWWMWTPVLVATAVFHVYGLVVLTRTEFRPTTEAISSRAGMTNLSLILALLASLMVVWSLFRGGPFLALGLYTTLPAFAVAAGNYSRSGDRSTTARTAVGIATVALVLGMALLELGIGLMGIDTLWFSGTG